MAADVLRVALVDGHLVCRTGVRTLLAPAADVTVVAEASNGAEAVALVRRARPDVVITALDLPDGDAAALIPNLLTADLPTRVLVLTARAEEERLDAALLAGASGYVTKSVSARELLDAVRAVGAGDLYVQSSAARALARGFARRAAARTEREQFARLSGREQEVLRLVARGFSGTEIAERLEISTKTVVTYRQRIHEKLGIAHRTEYVGLALKLELLAG